MANILSRITIGNTLVMVVDADPSAVAGTSAPIGSTATVSDGSGFFLKTGSANTDWTDSNTAANLYLFNNFT